MYVTLIKKIHISKILVYDIQKMNNREEITGPANQSTHESVTHALKITVFRDMVPCRLVQVNQHFRRAYCLHHRSPDDGSIKLHSNTDQLLCNYTAQYPRRLSSSYSLWEPEISTHALDSACCCSHMRTPQNDSMGSKLLFGMSKTVDWKLWWTFWTVIWCIL
jgi:hypothetical protein